jgi:putative acetyltransferase
MSNVNPIIRLIQPKDNAAVKAIIKKVMPEFGASSPGFAIHDPEVEDMHQAYATPRAAYFVCEINGAVVGGGGIAQLQGGNVQTCELKKMYFLPQARGKGYAQQLLESCLEAARKYKFVSCYLETFNTMHLAMKLYERNGFKKIKGAMGNTGHFACDIFYLLEL